MASSRYKTRRSVVCLAAALMGLLGTSWSAHAETVRRALLVAHGDGGEGLAKLRYTQRDVLKMKDVLIELGGFEPANVQLMFDEDSSDVLRALRGLEERVKADKAHGKDALLLVYYSGHAKDGSLRLGDTRLDMALLRGILEDSRADVRVAIVDACGAGEITREKGGRRAPPLVVSVDDALTSHGQVIIASSSETESSQESDEIQGSFFTHYWVSGLRGHADRDTDGKVTLDEAYAYAYARTVAATVHTRGGVQHPTYRYDLRGAGDVTMANLEAVTSAVRFPSDMSGRFVVFDMERQLVVAEVEKTRGEPLRLALKGGTYAIKKRETDHLLMQRVRVASEKEVVVDPARMERVAFDKDYAKGPIVAIEKPVVGQGLFGLSLSGGVGAQAFLDAPLPNGPSLDVHLARQPTFPSTPIATMQVRYHGLFNKHLLLGADFNFGGREYTEVVYWGANEKEQVSFPARFLMGELGASVMWEQEVWRFRFAAGPRLSAVVLYRHLYADVATPDQFFANLTPGVAAYAGFDIFRFLHLEAGFRGNYLVYATGGAFQSIGFGSFTLALHADL